MKIDLEKISLKIDFEKCLWTCKMALIILCWKVIVKSGSENCLWKMALEIVCEKWLWTTVVKCNAVKIDCNQFKNLLPTIFFYFSWTFTLMKDCCYHYKHNGTILTISKHVILYLENWKYDNTLHVLPEIQEILTLVLPPYCNQLSFEDGVNVWEVWQFDQNISHFSKLKEGVKLIFKFM